VAVEAAGLEKDFVELERNLGSVPSRNLGSGCIQPRVAYAVGRSPPSADSARNPFSF
jgi:hypothetical protein